MRRWLVVAAALLAGCTGSTGNNDDGSVNGDHKIPGDGTPPLVDSLLPPVPDGDVPPPANLPTFVNLDWSGFPKDPGPNYAVSGKTIVVKTSGNDGNPGSEASPMRTIAAALDKAASGDMVKVHGGSYSESWPDDYRALVMTKPNVVLTAAAGEQVTVTSSYEYGIAIEASNIVVNGINLQGFTYSIQIGRSSGQKNVVISNLTITGGSEGEGIIAYDQGSGTPVLDGLLVKNVTVLNAWMGISCNAGPCKSWRFENVKVDGGGGSGSGADAIAVEDGDNFLFHNVEVTGVAADGIDTKATRVVIWGCHVHHVERNGVKLWHGGDVVNTLIHHTGADAAVVTEEGPKTRLLHTVVAYHEKGGPTGYNMTFGYDSQAAQTVEIIDSIIYNTNGGTYFNGASNVLIENSLFFGIDDGMVLQSVKYGTVTLAHGPQRIDSLGMGSANIFADPKLNASFHLQAGSPAIDKGKKLSNQYYPTTDLAGGPRVKGSGPDIGPFEDF